MKILLDSDALFGLFIPDDVHHKETTRLLEECKNKEDSFFVLSSVIQETATVISHKRNHETSIRFVAQIDDLGAIKLWLDESLEDASWQIFNVQTKKGTSFIDCANLASIRYYHLDKIFSFDRFYPKELLLPVIQ